MANNYWLLLAFACAREVPADATPTCEHVDADRPVLDAGEDSNVFAGEGAGFGARIDISGVLDFDGYAIVSAPYPTDTESSNIYLLEAGQTTELVAGGVTSTGLALDGSVDLTGDGVLDLIVGGHADNFEVAIYDIHSTPVSRVQHLWADAGVPFGGAVLALPHDITGDGRREVLIGGNSELGDPSGGVWVVNFDSTLSSSEVAAVGEWWPGEYEVTGTGRWLERAGDIDGDGIEEILVGSTSYVYVVDQLDFEDPLPSASKIHVPLEVPSARPFAGVGDHTGDGYDDVAVGVPYQQPGLVGRVLLFAGPLVQDVVEGDAEGEAWGTVFAGSLGEAVSAAGDFNGDGTADFVVGAPGPGDTTGTAYIVTEKLCASYDIDDVAARVDGPLSGGPTPATGFGKWVDGPVLGRAAGSIAVGAIWSNNLQGAVYILDPM